MGSIRPLPGRGAEPQRRQGLVDQALKPGLQRLTSVERPEEAERLPGGLELVILQRRDLTRGRQHIPQCHLDLVVQSFQQCRLRAAERVVVAVRDVVVVVAHGAMVRPGNDSSEVIHRLAVAPPAAPSLDKAGA
jgi:hypothetical protein